MIHPSPSLSAPAEGDVLLSKIPLGFSGTVTLGTMLTRFLPFLLFPNSSKTPKFIRYLGKVLPYAVMGMLVVYCLRNVSFTTAPFGAPEALALACVAGLHLWKKNTLLSIGAGTTLYMVLIQFVFI